MNKFDIFSKDTMSWSIVLEKRAEKIIHGKYAACEG
jgi:hypothetical protein